MATKITVESNVLLFEDTTKNIRKKYPTTLIWYKVEDSTPKKYSIYSGYNYSNQILNLEYTEFVDGDDSGFSSETELEAYLDTILNVSNITDYSSSVAMSRYEDRSTVNKFGYNLDVDTSEVIIASWDAAFDPATDVITTAQTFDIAYNNTVDGSGQIGARVLLIQYLDANYEIQEATHVLSNTGNDTTSFTGFGINRAVVVAFGSAISNQDVINITATTDGTQQAQIPTNNNVTQQCLYHTPIGYNFLWSQFLFNSTKLSGGGQPEVTIKGFSFSRVTLGVYEVFRLDFDTQRGNSVVQTFKEPFVIGGREVLFFTAISDINDAQVNFRFSGILERV